MPDPDYLELARDAAVPSGRGPARPDCAVALAAVAQGEALAKIADAAARIEVAVASREDQADELTEALNRVWAGAAPVLLSINDSLARMAGGADDELEVLTDEVARHFNRIRDQLERIADAVEPSPAERERSDEAPPGLFDCTAPLTSEQLEERFGLRPGEVAALLKEQDRENARKQLEILKAELEEQRDRLRPPTASKATPDPGALRETTTEKRATEKIAEGLADGSLRRTHKGAEMPGAEQPREPEPAREVLPGPDELGAARDEFRPARFFLLGTGWLEGIRQMIRAADNVPSLEAMLLGRLNELEAAQGAYVPAEAYDEMRGEVLRLEKEAEQLEERLEHAIARWRSELSLREDKAGPHSPAAMYANGRIAALEEILAGTDGSPGMRRPPAEEGSRG